VSITRGMPLASIALPFSLAVTPGIFAQDVNSVPKTGPTSVANMANDPSTILTTAAEINGLHGPSLRPWHVKASYQTFDLKGKPRDSGTCEEFWPSDKRYRRPRRLFL
jgi:hypothetical protein